MLVTVRIGRVKKADSQKKLALNKYVMSLCIRNSECPIL